MTPYNYGFPAPANLLTLSSAATLTLPAIGSKPPSTHPGIGTNTYPAMSHQKRISGSHGPLRMRTAIR